MALEGAEAGKEADLEGDEGDELGDGDDVLRGHGLGGQGVDGCLIDLGGVLGDGVAVAEEEGEAALALGGLGCLGEVDFGRGAGFREEGGEVRGEGGFAVLAGDAEGEGGAFGGGYAAGLGGDDELAVSALGVGADVCALGAEFGEGGAGFDGEEGFDQVVASCPA